MHFDMFGETFTLADFLPDLAIFFVELLALALIVPIYVRWLTNRRQRHTRMVLLHSFIRYAHIRFVAYRDIVEHLWFGADLQKAIGAYQKFDDFRVYYEQQAAIYSQIISDDFGRFVPGALLSQGAFLRSFVLMGARRHNIQTDLLSSFIKGYDIEHADANDHAVVADAMHRGFNNQTTALMKIAKVYRTKGYNPSLPNLFFEREDEFSEISSLKEFCKTMDKSSEYLKDKLLASN